VGEGYRRWLAPEFSYYATPSRTWPVLLTWLWGPIREGDLSKGLRYSTTSARDAKVSYPTSPGGDRRFWTLTVRWVG
jgi:hypothetical protein